MYNITTLRNGNKFDNHMPKELSLNVPDVRGMDMLKTTATGQ